MTKIVINRCYGGFDLSRRCKVDIARRKNGGNDPYVYKSDSMGGVYRLIPLDEFLAWDVDSFDIAFMVGTDLGPIADVETLCANDLLDFLTHGDTENIRIDRDLVDSVETLGTEAASGRFGSLKVVEVPDDVKWYISEYDGMESVEEEHRSWR